MAFIHHFRESCFEYLAITSSAALFGMLTGPFYSNLRQRQALLIYLSAERCWGSRNLMSVWEVRAESLLLHPQVANLFQGVFPTLSSLEVHQTSLEKVLSNFDKR